MTRIALFQSSTGVDPQASARALADAVAESASGGAEMLFTPEMSGLLDRDQQRARKNLRSEKEDSVLAACCEAARAHRIWLHVGSLAVLTEDDKVANRGFIIDREGQVRARYDKIHLFDLEVSRRDVGLA
ncbi:MAG TPA: nitrilase-related carbon-nitrogen hydrolase [Sphingomicrobium sp.]|nr:nitrilase-related carbon-nitrogen hydrolase [Sphingomicrobium sp.]